MAFPDLPGLRPSPDRVRETMFNWLSPVITGSICLDLFAGSGALGFEALSRGAAHAMLVDQSQAAIQQLQETQQKLKADQAKIVCDSAIHFLQRLAAPFDIIFLDPPFHEHLIPSCLEIIRDRRLLRPEGYIYIEQALDDKPWMNPCSTPLWKIIKEKRAGQVLFQLIQYI